MLKLHLKRATQGEGWSHVEPKDSGPDVGHPYQTPKKTNKPQEGKQVAQPGRSLLTSELLALGKELIREIVQAVAHIPKLTPGPMWKCRSLIHPRVLNPRLAGPGMMSTWSVPTPLNQGWHPQLWLRRTRCWMKQFPGPLELVGQVPMKTLAAQKTINLLGSYSPESPCISLKTDYFPAALDWRLKFRRCGIKKLQYFNQICRGGPTRSGLARPDPFLLFKF